MQYDARPDTIVQKVILHQNLVLKGTIVRLTPVHINHVRPVLIVQLDLKHQQLVQQDTTVRPTPLMLYNAQRGTIVRKMDSLHIHNVQRVPIVQPVLLNR